jgi:hypothetical protein
MELTDLTLDTSPWELRDGKLYVKATGLRCSSPRLGRNRYTQREVIKYLTKLQPKIKMTIIKYGHAFHLRSKDGQVHSTRYASRDAAAVAAHKIAAGLIHFAPLVNQVTTANLSNRT